MSTDSGTQTVIGHSTADKALLYGGLPLLGLVLGFFLPRIADWASAQRWVPLQGPLELIARWDSWWVVPIFVAVGGIAGFLLGAIAMEDTLKTTITTTRESSPAATAPLCRILWGERLISRARATRHLR